MQEHPPRWSVLHPPDELRAVLSAAPRVHVAGTCDELFELACGGAESRGMDVVYSLPGSDKKTVVEATVARVRNGVAVNYTESYMRRRDPNSMVVADELPTDKPQFEALYGQPFGALRQETFDWLAAQELALFAFRTGGGDGDLGEAALAVAPANAGFFPLGLALLQGILAPEDLPSDFAPRVVVYVAPVFRHTFFKGKQVVVHNRREGLYEIFSYNLYPGPSAKKGIYGTLIQKGENEGWVAAHCSAVQVVTPYDNVVTIMHEGASGSGKSEMLEQPHRQPDGQLLLGRNLVTGEERFVEITRTCDLHPVCDDMALCHPSLQKQNQKLWIVDGEKGWFVRVNHITEYGTDPNLEKLTAQPPRPLLFLSIDAVAESRALIWEHIEDEPGVPCPNPRVVIPREIVPDIVNDAVEVDIRSFGIRTPPCTRATPNYGILGLFHVLPPALAWLWRLVAPRGYANPSIVDTKKMSSEGVGSYWPFAAGRRVKQANLLLQQIEEATRTRYVIIPNQHVGAWKVGFMSEWLVRDYLARRGAAKFKDSQIVPARCPLLGYALRSMRIEGTALSHWFLEVNTQPEVGDDGYDRGAAILQEFFREHLAPFLEPDLLPLGRRIIECCLEGGSVADYEEFLGRSE